jgi:hypothetical protein
MGEVQVARALDFGFHVIMTSQAQTTMASSRARFLGLDFPDFFLVVPLPSAGHHFVLGVQNNFRQGHHLEPWSREAHENAKSPTCRFGSPHTLRPFILSLSLEDVRLTAFHKTTLHPLVRLHPHNHMAYHLPLSITHCVYLY